MADEDAPDPDVIREAVERSRSGAPAVGSAVRDRFSTDEIFQRIVAVADEEVTSGARELFFSALAAGFAISITFLLYASMYGATGGHPVLSALLYPLGFVYIIIGGYQLYTENTLPPVALTLERLVSLPALVRHWGIVLAGNFAGGAFGAAVLAWGGVLSPESAQAAAALAGKGLQTAWWSLFAKASFAGLIVAGVVWVEYAAQDTITRLVVVYLAFLAIPLGDLFHVVVSFTETVYMVALGEMAARVGLTHFVLPVLLGNTVGGVVLVTVVNYFQTTEERLQTARFEGTDRQLTTREWLFGGLVGRSYVPVVDTAAREAKHEEAYRVLIAFTDARRDERLVNLGCVLASQHDEGVVYAMHVIQPPQQGLLSVRSDRVRRLTRRSKRQLESVQETASSFGVDCETSTILSHRSFEEVFDTAEETQADLVVMGWSSDRPWSSGRTEGSFSELTAGLPCDFLVLRDRRMDASSVLVPTAGGPDSELSAEVARALREGAGAEVTLLHVVDDPQAREDAEAFLASWAEDQGLESVEQVVDTTGRVKDAIVREAREHSLVVLGATETGVLSRLVTGSVHMDIVDEVECSVLMAERPQKRGLFERLFARP